MSVKIMVPYPKTRLADTWLEANSFTNSQYYVTHQLEPDEAENLVILGCEYEFYSADDRLLEFALKFS